MHILYFPRLRCVSISLQFYEFSKAGDGQQDVCMESSVISENVVGGKPGNFMVFWYSLPYNLPVRYNMVVTAP